MGLDSDFQTKNSMEHIRKDSDGQSKSMERHFSDSLSLQRGWKAREVARTCALHHVADLKCALNVKYTLNFEDIVTKN